MQKRDENRGTVLAYDPDLNWVDVELEDGRIVTLKVSEAEEYDDYDQWEACYYCK